jgi:hypothetical protein
LGEGFVYNKCEINTSGGGFVSYKISPNENYDRSKAIGEFGIFQLFRQHDNK